MLRRHLRIRVPAGAVLGLVTLGIAPASAPAARATLSDVDGPSGRAVVLLYRASPNEVNTVGVVINRAFPLSYRITDITAPLHAGAGCSRVTAHQVVCAERAVVSAPGTVETRTLSVGLGNLNDKLVAPSVGISPPGLTIKADGGTGADRLTGSELRGGAGNDVMFAVRKPGGTAHIYGDSGNDQVAGSPGADFLSGGSGNDILAAGAGNDVLVGGPGIDLMFGGPGIDRLDGRIRDKFSG